MRGGEGAEIVYSLKNNPTLASMAIDNIAKSGQISRGIYQRVLPENPSKDYYYILRETGNVEPILVEYGFIDNPSDSKKLVNNITDYVEGVVKAIADYIGVEYLPPTQEPNTENTHTVKRGDTLYSIASKYNLTVEELKALNNLTSNEIYIGQILQVNPILGSTYIVQRGDTLYSISKKYNVSVDDLKEVNNLNTNVLYIGQELLIPSGIIEDDDEVVEGDFYVVQKGDSLYSIARKLNINIQDLIELNNLENNTIQENQKLLIPNSTITNTYIVQRGDTLWSISKKYNVSVNDLKRANNLTNNLLSVGQQLIIP